MAKTDEHEEEKKGKPILIISLVAGLVVLFMGMMISLIFIIKSSSDIKVTVTEPVTKTNAKGNDKAIAKGDAPKAEAKSEPQAKSTPVGSGKPQFYKFKPTIVVTLLDMDKVRYLQLDIELMTRNSSTLEELESLSPLLRNDLINLLTSQKYDEIITAEGKERLRMRALEIVKRVMSENTGKDDVEQVLFTNFVTQ